MKGPVSSTTQATPTPLRVLVVSDEPSVRRLVSFLLVRDGHSVDTAIDGRSGLARVQDTSYDAVITDRVMPVMGGDEFAFSVKEIEPSVAVIMMTALGHAMLASGERPPGVDAIVAKPFTNTALHQALAAVGCL